MIPSLLTACRDLEFLESLVAEVVENVKGRRVKVEGEDDDGSEKA